MKNFAHFQNVKLYNLDDNWFAQIEIKFEFLSMGLIVKISRMTLIAYLPIIPKNIFRF